ncbi:MAG: class I SAM-dependent methyltransferase [Deltaproteobacteria bacterium]|nr:class I SAM-dependent methyltransferase [Deltaproteobacteria bacterium]
MALGRLEKIIDGEFRKSGAVLAPRELHRFALLDLLLNEKREELDLTRIENPLNLINKHYVDGVLASGFLDPPGSPGAKGLLMDIGSGAGFPGIPIAIARPDLKLLLAEPRKKRLDFMETVVNVLGLENVEFHPHKVGPSFDRPVANAITRDFMKLDKTLSLVADILPPGGKLYLMKGTGVNGEMREAEKSEDYGRFEFVFEKSYGIGGLNLERRLLRFDKKAGSVRGENGEEREAREIPRDNVTEIGSPRNATYRGFLRLLDAGRVKKDGLAVVSGPKFAKDILAKRPSVVRGIIAKKASDLKSLDFPEDVRIYLLRPELFSGPDLFNAGPPLLLCSVPELPRWRTDLELPGINLFAPFQDPANVGALIRTATAMGARVILLRDAANPFHPKALRAAGPAVFQGEILRGPGLEELAESGLPNLFALSGKGRDIREFARDHPPVSSLNLAIGREGRGLDGLFPESVRLRIPMKGDVESLNATAAAAMALAILGPKFS